MKTKNNILVSLANKQCEFGMAGSWAYRIMALIFLLFGLILRYKIALNAEDSEVIKMKGAFYLLLCFMFLYISGFIELVVLEREKK